jgi:hypothetical protein
VSQAVAKAKEIHSEVVKSITGGGNLPGLDQMMAKFLGNNPPNES